VTNPEASIIIPLRNAEPFIGQTLDSLLSERGILIEVVIVEDGSTDQSGQIIAAYTDERIQVIQGPQAGIAAAFNAGLAAVRGPIVSRCDADDLFPAKRIARQVHWLHAHPEYGAVCGSFSSMDSQGRLVCELETGSQAGDITDELRSGKTRTHFGTYAVRTHLLRDLKGCRTFFETAEDIDIQLRIGSNNRVWYEPIQAYCYRLHDASSTHMQATPRREFYEQTARDYARQRNNTGQDDLERGCPPTPPDATDHHARSANAQIQSLLLGQAWRQRKQGDRFKAIGTALRACAVQPINFRVWKSLLVLCVKPSCKL
jgi:glycosyltransferase involved in cell wall biosynthesis